MADFEPTGGVSVNYTVKELIAQVLTRLDTLDTKWTASLENLRTTKADHVDLVLLGSEVDKLRKDVSDKAAIAVAADLANRVNLLEKAQATEEGARGRSVKVAIAFGTIGALISIANFIVAHVH